MNASNDFTRIAIGQVGELDRRLSRLHTRKELNRKIAAYRKNERTSSARSYRAEVCFLLEDLGVSFEKDRDAAYYQRLADSLDEALFDVEGQMQQILFDLFDSYPSPQDYLTRIVDTFEDPADGWQKDPLRLRILKAAMKYAGGLAGFKSGKSYLKGKEYVLEYCSLNPKDPDACIRAADMLDDGVFSILDTYRKENPKKKIRFGSGPYLLKIIDNLADAQFLSGGGFQIPLYCLALIYDIPYARADELGTEQDVLKYLFEDYYNSSFVRYFNRETRRLSEKGGYEKDPKGQNISYKNCEERIYLYWLANEPDRLKRIKAISRTVSNVEKARKKAVPEEVAGREPRETVFFRDEYEDRAFTLESEEEFTAHLIENYQIESYDEKELGPDENRTASWIARQMMEEVLAAGAVNTYEFTSDQFDHQEEWRIAGMEEGRLPGLAFADSETLFLEGADPERLEAFRDLLRRVDEYLRMDRRELELYTRPDTITRTRLLALFHAKFWQEEEGNPQLEQASFLELFRKFKQYVDPDLIECSYLPLNPKNLYDVLLVSSLYASSHI